MGEIVFETALGYIALAERNRALLVLTFGHSNERTASRALALRLKGLELPANDSFVSDYQRDELIDRLREFAQGVPTDFSDLVVETPGATSFQRRVIDACRTISWGETLSYGELAHRAGRPGAARAVGSVMAANRVPLVVPCHRVVAAGGGLGGYSAPQGLAMKRRLLAAEQEVSVTRQLVAG
jgi:methylated-DNA-[protein]-cysteine S-methyltransferase